MLQLTFAEKYLRPTQAVIVQAKRRWLVYFFGFIFTALTCASQSLGPKFVQWFIDLIAQKKVPGFIAESDPVLVFRTLFFGFVGVLLFQFLSRKGWRATLGRETHQVSAPLKSLVWAKARFFPIERLQTDLGIGPLMNIATSDVGSARMIFGWTLVGGFDFLMLTLFALVGMWSVNHNLTLIVCLVLPLIPVLVYSTARLEYRSHQTAQEALSEFNDLTAQAVATVRLARLSGSEKFWIKKLTKSADDYRVKRLKVVYIWTRFVVLLGSPVVVATALLFVFSIPKVISGAMTQGEFVAFHSFVVMIQAPWGELGFLISEWQRGLASLDRILRLSQVPTAVGLYPQGGDAWPADQAIGHNPVFHVSDLRFAYPDKPSMLIQKLSFNLRSGERLGILGPIGSGKTTLVNILSGFERRFDGLVLLFGRDIRTYSNAQLRKFLALVDQRSFLFADSIRNNLVLNREFSEAELWQVLEVCGLEEEVRSFPAGLDTQLGEWGINLSGGQKQRLTIARAILGRPKVLILDDCLSAVDTVTEDRILKALDQYLVGTTLIWVAHRDSTLRYCNAVINLTIHGMVK